MDDLLIKYILEETTAKESEQVQQWLAADAANRARFEKLQAVWQLAAQPKQSPATDTAQALQRLKQTLQARETAPVRRLWPRIWTAAAAVVGMAGVALGAYVLIKPKAAVKVHPPVVQPDTVQKKPVWVDTVPAMPPVPAIQPVPAMRTDTVPFMKPHKKKRPVPATPAQPVHVKKKAAQQPRQPIDATPIKKKRAVPVPPANPVKKHKSRPPTPAKEPPIS